MKSFKEYQDQNGREVIKIIKQNDDVVICFPKDSPETSVVKVDEFTDLQGSSVLKLTCSDDGIVFCFEKEADSTVIVPEII